MEDKAVVFDIKKFAIHDGPGIRTTVFLKGCPLSCRWCQNPESQDARPEISFFPHLCIGCGKCLAACPLSQPAGQVDRELCLRCGKCAEVCPGEARKLAGRAFGAEELIDEVKKDKLFFDNSGGGVTVSGGEPMLQAGFLRGFLKLCRINGIHTAIDTCGYAAWEDFEKVAEYTDLFLYDIKVTDPARHLEYTGADNGLILQNLAGLADLKKNIIIRIPLIPGYTDSPSDMEETAAFIGGRMGRRIIRVELLPYNRLAEAKYVQSSIYRGGSFAPYRLRGAEPQDADYLLRLRGIFERSGIPVFLEAM
ncbi:MAG: glycyl-radical enzyme activating protein [Clostridia bacterium]|nr:glycyl-radical enzyme activating protein [Clostridia bacterium]